MPRLEASEREAWHMQAEHRVSKGPGLRLANATSLTSSGMHLGHRLLPTRLTSPLPPSSRSLDAARLDRGMPSARGLTLAYWLGRVPGGITGIRLRAVRGTGGAARARMPSAPSPGLRHGAVVKPMDTAPQREAAGAREPRCARACGALRPRDGRRGALAVKRKDEEEAVVRSVPALVVPSHPRIVAFSGGAGVMATAGLRRLDLCMTAVFSREQAFAHTQHTIDAASLHHLLFAAVHQGRVWAARCTNGKLLKAARQLQETCAGRAQLRSAPLRISPVLVAVDARGDEEVMGKGGWWISFRRGPSKMAYPVGIILYAILQFIAFLFVLVGTPIDMFRGTTKDLFNISLCITLWGSKFECKTIMYAMPTDDQWKFCPTRLQHFHIAQILSIISVFVYALAALLGFIMLCCCSLLRWLCLVFNIAGIITLGITWGFMVVEYGRNESRFCPPLRKDYKFGVGFALFMVAWVLNLIDIIFLMLPWQIGESGKARQLHDDVLVEEPAELMPAGKTEGAEAADARP
ncbi:Amastin surface glycofamily protein [Leishmania donovani]|uniref:Amastin surface glycofamily protein n=1 Tax=Leishmania donovani TaxID=5661 RepID=A0A504Y1U7_LEIDO|nr:Amastin surface glycofamily protein [Leishmania donovani]